MNIFAYIQQKLTANAHLVPVTRTGCHGIDACKFLSFCDHFSHLFILFMHHINKSHYLEAPHSALIVSKRFSARSFARSRPIGSLLDNNKCSGCGASASRADAIEILTAIRTSKQHNSNVIHDKNDLRPVHFQNSQNDVLLVRQLLPFHS